MQPNNYQPQSWGQRTLDFKLPSGDVCLIKANIDLPDLIELGVVEHFDSLGMFVQTKHVDRVKKPQDRKPTKAQLEAKEEEEFETKWQGILKDKKKFSSLAEVMDKVVCAVVIKPTIHLAYKEIKHEDGTRWVKILDNERNSTYTYTDNIPFMDKMEIFNYVTAGINRLKRFPDRSSEDLGDVANKSETEDSPE